MASFLHGEVAHEGRTPVDIGLAQGKWDSCGRSYA